jgi:hypothetical protein
MPTKIQEELDLIEGEVSRGNYALKELGFWKIVAGVKRDPALIDRFADQIGRIDKQVFEKKAWIKVNIWAGHVIEAAGTILGLGLIWLSIYHASEIIRSLSIVFASLVLSSTLHPLAHWVVGRALGIRFLFYFPNGPIKIEPSLKTDYGSYLRARPRRRAIMHVSGPVATNLAALICLVIGLSMDISQWAIWILLLYFLFMLGTEIFISPKAGDIKRVLREWRI